MNKNGSRLTVRDRFRSSRRPHGVLFLLVLGTVAAMVGPTYAVNTDREDGASSHRREYIDLSGRRYLSANPPMRFLAAGRKGGVKPRSSSQCTVHIVLLDDLDSNFVFPCAALFVPPEGRAVAWMEDEWQISDRLALMNLNPAAGDSLKSPNLTFPPLVHAGLVRIQNLTTPQSNVQARLIHASIQEHDGGVLDREFWRRSSPEDFARGVLMPVGQVIVALYDRDDNVYTALSGRVDVNAGSVSDVAISPPKRQKSDLIVQVERAHARVRWFDADIDVELETSTQRLKPHFVVSSLGRVHSFWWGLDSSTATIHVLDEVGWAKPVEIPLRAGHVEATEIFLTEKPDLNVTLEIPKGVYEDGTVLKLLGTDKDEVLQSVPVSDATNTDFTLSHVAPALLKVRILSSTWVFEEKVDMRDGKSRHVTLSPPTFTISGRIAVCGEPSRALVGFVSARSRRGQSPIFREVATNEAGVYELSNVVGQVFPEVRIRALDPVGGQFDDVILEPLVDGMVFDWDLACSKVTVSVLEEDSLAPVENAQVVAIPDAEGQRSVRGTTDTTGETTLDPVPKGRIRIVVRAPGFKTSEEHEIVVADEAEYSISISLSRETGSKVRVRLPHGGPAPYADVAVFGDLGSRPMWLGQCDQDGLIQIPESVGARWIAARHPEAAFRVVPVADGFEEMPETISLSSTSTPTVFRFVDGAREPVPYAAVVLWVDGMRLSNDALAWLARSADAAFPDGTWAPRLPLPAGSLEILGWNRMDPSHRSAFSRGDYDYLRVPIPPNSGSTVEIEVVEP